jgi:hypothetical protein
VHVLAIVGVVVLVILGGLVAFVMVLGVWTRRGEAKPDAPGVQTACTFRGGGRYMTAEEKALEAEQGSLVLGEGIVTALTDALRGLGVGMGEPDADDMGWGVRARLGQRSAYLQVWRDVGDADDWILVVRDPSSGGPGPAELPPVVGRALGTLAGIEGVIWHPRERLLHEGKRSA